VSQNVCEPRVCEKVISQTAQATNSINLEQHLEYFFKNGKLLAVRNQDTWKQYSAISQHGTSIRSGPKPAWEALELKLVAYIRNMHE
jgi:hypothetical protein